MKKPRIALTDPHILSVDHILFNDAKAAIGKPCRTPVGVSADGREFEEIEGYIMAVDSRPFKGCKDAVYVGIKTIECEFYVYAEFRFVEVLGKVGEPLSSKPVIAPKTHNYNGKMLRT
jgi:hypothetical protein